MNTSKIKTYAIQARRDFIKAVTERANSYGIFGDNNIEEIKFTGDLAIIGDRAVTKKEGELRQLLLDRIKRDGFEMIMQAAAYTWFNRFVALRYMEIHDYLLHGFRVLSNPSGSDMPEILEHVADINLEGLNKENAIELRLAGSKDNELYRLLIIAQCNALNRAMPFLFDRIDNETELLLPENLLNSDSTIRKLVAQIDESDWQNVEIIGWIYQFYISEKKDEVIGKVVKSEDIPAATQLFTPNWIVKYMVQNTLGRMWLATYPDSPLRSKMEYYIVPADQKPEVQKQLDAITPRELNPETITFLDPASGSGHILVESYDIFKEIYLERGYRTKDIPSLILEKNLYGLDICDRATQLAGFAVLMKARADDHKILSDNNLKLNILAIQSGSHLNADDLANKLLEEKVVWLSNPNTLFPESDGQLILKNRKKYEINQEDIIELINLFEDAKTFGSLITIPEHITGQLEAISGIVDEKLKNGDLFEKDAAGKLLPIVKQAMILARKYDCVVTNPPYMGKGMNDQLKTFLKNKYNDVKSDLFSAFVIRCSELGKDQANIGIMTPNVWMYISSHEKLRGFLIERKTLVSLVELPLTGFKGATVQICTYIFINRRNPNFIGGFIRLVGFKGGDEEMACYAREAINNPNCGWFHRASASDFKKIPGNPIAYWLYKNEYKAFQNQSIYDFSTVCIGMKTGDNELFVRAWQEVSNSNIGYYVNSLNEANQSSFTWFPYLKGGNYRKWHGNYELVLNWIKNGENIKNHINKNGVSDARIRPSNFDYYFKVGINWSFITSGLFGVRIHDKGFFFDVAGSSLFSKGSARDEITLQLAGYLNTKITRRFLGALNPTLNMQIENIKCLPLLLVTIQKDSIREHVSKLKSISKSDWNSYETSWDFSNLPFLQSEHYHSTLKAAYANLRIHWRTITLIMQHLEEENNRIFIDAYGLQDELTPDVPLSEITLTCNPHYRYGGGKTEEELETFLLTDTMKELISYSIGCMMGRYSLNEPGLIYANSGNIGFDQSKYKKFPADGDGIIPVMDMDWFSDDAVNRFIEFLKVAWPQESLNENLKFIADSLNPKRGEVPIDTIRRYLSTGFFKDHLKTYKKRPIYWLFSSGKQKAFECLVYLHRYNEATLSRMRSLYVTPLQGNIRSRIEFLQKEKDAASSASEQRKFQKELDMLKKKQAELSKFDDELRHYADMRITLDLDDGVKVNYGKFGNLLAEVKNVTGDKQEE